MAILTEQGMKEPSARAYLGSLLRDWDEEDVILAMRASVGKVDARAYVRKVLANRPKKADKQSRLQSREEQTIPANREAALAAIAKAREILRR